MTLAQLDMLLRAHNRANNSSETASKAEPPTQRIGLKEFAALGGSR